MRTQGVKEPVAESNDAAKLDFLFVTRSVKVGEQEFSFREMSVKESDACLDAARKEDGTIDGRLNMRMIISKSSVSPKISVDDIARMPNRVYLKFAEFVNDLNSIDDAEESKDEEAGKD